MSLCEREQGTGSKQGSTRESLLLVHPALPWDSPSAALFTCVLSSELAPLLTEAKQRPQMQQRGSALVLSLTGTVPVFDSRPTTVPGCNLLCDPVASLRVLTCTASVEDGSCSRGFWPSHLRFAQQRCAADACSSLLLLTPCGCPSTNAVA